MNYVKPQLTPVHLDVETASCCWGPMTTSASVTISDASGSDTAARPIELVVALATGKVTASGFCFVPITPAQ